MIDSFPLGGQQYAVDDLAVKNFLMVLETAMDVGDTGIVEANTERLQALIDRIQRRVFDLSALQYRACVVRDRYFVPGKTLRQIRDAT